MVQLEPIFFCYFYAMSLLHLKYQNRLYFFNYHLALPFCRLFAILFNFKAKFCCYRFYLSQACVFDLTLEDKVLVSKHLQNFWFLEFFT